MELELLPIEVSHCGNRKFRPFRLLWPWPWPDDLHIRTRSVFRGDMLRVQIWTFYVKAFESYRLTDIQTHIYTQTDTTKIICHATLRVIKDKMWRNLEKVQNLCEGEHFFFGTDVSSVCTAITNVCFVLIFVRRIWLQARSCICQHSRQIRCTVYIFCC